MRNDHAFQEFLATREAVESAMRRAHRMRAEAVHAYLKRAVRWLRGALGPTAVPAAEGKAPTPQRC